MVFSPGTVAHAVLNATSSALMVVDPQSRIFFVNHTAEKLFGISVAKVKGGPLSAALSDPVVAAAIASLVARVSRGDREFQVDSKLKDATGNLRHIKWDVLPLAHRDLPDIMALLVGRDVTRQFAAEEALRRSESRLRALVETAVDAIITIDDHGKIESVNPAAEKMFGYTAAEMLGKGVEMLMPDPYRGEHHAYLSNYLHTGKRRVIGIGREVTGQRRDGSLFPMYLSVGEQTVDGRRYFTGIVRDITNVKRMEVEVLEISEREQQRIGQDLHDGLGQLLTGAAFMTKAMAGRLEKLDANLAHEMQSITQIMNDCIRQSRELARGLQPVSEAAELPSALAQMATQVEHLFQGVACRVQSAVLPPEVPVGVATHLYRIAQEAVGNAVRHGQARHIELSLRTLGPAVRLMIRDDGKGIAARGGDGMGLKTMSYRARAIGGHFDIRSTPGHGTIVICSIGWPDTVEKEAR